MRLVGSQNFLIEDKSGQKFWREIIEYDAQIFCSYPHKKRLRLALGIVELRTYIWRSVQAILLLDFIEKCFRLKCWRPDVRKTRIVVKPLGLWGGKMGNCEQPPDIPAKVEIYASGILAEDISTTLHELAHVDVNFRERAWHGALWRKTYVKAAKELTGLPVVVDHFTNLSDNGVAQDRFVVSTISNWLNPNIWSLM